MSEVNEKKSARLACFAWFLSACSFILSVTLNTSGACLTRLASTYIHTIYIHTLYIHVPYCPPPFFPHSLRASPSFSSSSFPSRRSSALPFLFPIHSLVRFFLLPFLPFFCPLRLPLPSHLHFSCFCLLELSQLGVALSFGLRQGPFFSALPPPQAPLPPFTPLQKRELVKFFFFFESGRLISSW
ncbi:hypothetical protein L873DRAFT_81915 [Choiromyces venosus 120613-1]|uniref:Uncharacterized protein n=1 Tax=Choiromyces venosus 120613-1 TaxID=1336337 RepID=A0A3N4J4B4_9PEZI|nr:hypothetical protein L873DRAFT_81915 [Choiromyces venosus 120613-1]